MVGAWPLASETDQLSESGVGSGWDRWVDASVWSPEDGFAVSVVLDGPSMFVEEPVVVTAEEDQIVQVGGSSVCPMCLVMSVEPTWEGTSRPSTATITEPELTT